LGTPEGRRSYQSQSQLYVATPVVLQYLGTDPTVDPRTDFLVDRSVRTDGLVIPSPRTREEFALTNVQRTLTATTAGALALLGAILGVAGACVLLAATYHDDLGYLSDVPVLYVALAVVGVPMAASAAGWLLAGREPPAITRTVIE
jgi:hypothetical protein